MFGITSTAAYAARPHGWPFIAVTDFKTSRPQESHPPAAAASNPETAQSVFAEAAMQAPSSSSPFEFPARAADLDYLKTCLREVEDALERRMQLPTGKLTSIETPHLKPLVALANIENPGLNAHIVNIGPDRDFRVAVDRSMREGTQSARFMVTTNGTRHYAAADYRRIGDKASVILLEPLNGKYLPPSLLHFRVHRGFKDNPDIAYAMIEMDIQKSPADCRMFSFSLLKKLLKAHEHFQVLHERHLAGSLPVSPQWAIKGAAADALLPPSFLKHAHSWTRIDRYLEARPDMVMHPINGRAETLAARHMRSRVRGTNEDGKVNTYNRGIEEKRRDCLAHLLTACSEGVQRQGNTERTAP